MELNRTERRALAAALLLVGLGAVGRAVLGPAPGEHSWRGPDDTGRVAALGGLSEARDAVADALRDETRALEPLAPGERLDPNAASEVELRRLPGIGPSRARAIVEERRRRPFRDTREIQRVAGIGPATYERLAPFLEVAGGAAGVGEPPGGVRGGVAGGRGTAATAVPPTTAATTGAPAAPGCGGVREAVDLNVAGLEELVGLPGIGPARAARIVKHRSRVGRFTAPEQLEAVPGIGPATVARLRGLVCARADGAP